MTTVRITDAGGNKPSFVQWDVDRILYVSGVASQPCLHFANAELKRAIVVEATDDNGRWKCLVPNFILQFALPVIVSVFTQPEGGEGRTEATVVIGVQPRMKPQDYTYEENIGYINWVDKSQEVQDLLDAIQAKLDSGELKGEKGDPGDSGVYIGVETPTDPSIRVWIDPTGGESEMTLGIDSEDGLLYLYVNGTRQGTGIEIGGVPSDSFEISYSLSNATLSNSPQRIEKGRTFVTIVTANVGHVISSVDVSLDGDPLENVFDEQTSTIRVQNVSGNLSIAVKARQLVPFETVTFSDTLYGIGNNNAGNYNAWAPGCAHYDSHYGKVIFLQCHRTKHSGTYSASQLWAIDPYDVMNGAVLLHEFSPVGGYVPLGFTIDTDGTYYVLGSGIVYSSSDHGDTWTEETIQTRPGKRYGLQIIDGVMYTGNDSLTSSGNGKYYTSDDYGLNWVENVFDFADDYPDDLTCSEANFIKFNGRIFAALRREAKSGILAVQNDGVWEVLSESLPSNTSDTYMFSTDSDVICFVAIDRPNKTLKIGTIEISDNDEVTITVAKSATVETQPGDFHTPTYVVGPDFSMVTFMVSAYGVEYSSASNVALVGYTTPSLNQNPDYTITKYTGSVSDIENTPYAGTQPVKSGSHWVLASGSIINLARRYPNTFPLEDGKVVFYKPNKAYAQAIGTANVYARMIYDVIDVDSVKYCCLVNGYNSSSALTGKLKAMYPASKTYLVDAEDIGGVVPSDGTFTYAFNVRSDLSSETTITAYLITADAAE